MGSVSGLRENHGAVRQDYHSFAIRQFRLNICQRNFKQGLNWELKCEQISSFTIFSVIDVTKFAK